MQLRRDKFEIDGLRDYLVFNPLTNLFKPERGPRDTIEAPVDPKTLSAGNDL